MSLVSFVIIGKDKSPLYLRDFTDEFSSFYSEEETPTAPSDEGEDPFGFFENRTAHLNESSSLKNQVC